MRKHIVMMFADYMEGVQGLGGFSSPLLCHSIQFVCEDCGTISKTSRVFLDDEVVLEGKKYHGMAKCASCDRLGTLCIDMDEAFFSSLDITGRYGAAVGCISFDGLMPHTYELHGSLSVLKAAGGVTSIEAEAINMEIDHVIINGLNCELRCI